MHMHAHIDTHAQRHDLESLVICLYLYMVHTGPPRYKKLAAVYSEVRSTMELLDYSQIWLMRGKFANKGLSKSSDTFSLMSYIFHKK